MRTNLVFVVSVVLVGCGSVVTDECFEECLDGQVCYYGTCVPDEDAVGGDADAESDVGPDTDVDADHDDGSAEDVVDVEADADAEPDADADYDDGTVEDVVDIGADAEADAEPDVGPDADADADYDDGTVEDVVDVEVDADVDVDVGPDADAGVDADADVPDDAGCDVPCGSSCCSPGESCCDGRCVNTGASDPYNCGGCGVVCDPRVSTRCVAGQCLCGNYPACNGVGAFPGRECAAGMAGGPQVCCETVPGSSYFQCRNVSNTDCGTCGNTCYGSTCLGELAPSGDSCTFYCG